MGQYPKASAAGGTVLRKILMVNTDIRNTEAAATKIAKNLIKQKSTFGSKMAITLSILETQYNKMKVQTDEGKTKYLYNFEMLGFAVDRVILSDDPDQTYVLLVRRGPKTEPREFAGCWAVPGGFVNYGKETDDEASHREMKEEAGVHGPASLTWRVTVASDPDRDPRQHQVSSVFCEIRQRTKEPMTTNDPDEVSGVQWWPVKQVLAGQIPMAFDHVDLIRRANAQYALYLASARPQQEALRAFMAMQM
jgi:8-oxo-dGTP diphosphatase